MRTNRRRPTIQLERPLPPSDLKYLDDIAGRFCELGHKKPPSTEDGERLIRESPRLSGRHLAWYQKASQNEGFEDALDTKMLDLRANNPA